MACRYLGLSFKDVVYLNLRAGHFCLFTFDCEISKLASVHERLIVG